MKFSNDAGILLPIFSLPSAYGVGDFGPAAEEWIRLLKSSGQSLWQVLPLGPTGYGNSPYQSPSAFALNPLFISLDHLVTEGFLGAEDLEDAILPPSSKIDYKLATECKMRLLKKAARQFLNTPPDTVLKKFETFCLEEHSWLEDFAVFISIKQANNERPWWEWPAEMRNSRSPEVSDWIRWNTEEIREVMAIQFFAETQWGKLRALAKACSVQIMGDMPIFVAHDSADVWSNPELFRLNPDGSPEVVAGVPPDYFSSTGQLWGNPIYNWPLHQKDGFSWWISRIKRLLTQFDLIRIDHFRGFAAYWEIPGGDSTAQNGRWVEAPGRAFFQRLEQEFESTRLPLIAEDLGVITPEVEKLRNDFNLPGIRILQFAFGTDPMKHTFIPEAYTEHCVAYSGTHDNDTVAGWFLSKEGQGSSRGQEEIEEERVAALEYFQSDGHAIHWDFIRSLYRSRAGAVIVPLQDVLGLGTESRINTPGVASGNWVWKINSLTELLPAMRQLEALTLESARGLKRKAKAHLSV